MQDRRMVGILVVLAGTVVLTQCRPPTPVAAAVEIAPGAVADADQATLTELTGAFDQVEAAVQKGDVEALMPFYAKAYNYHGLKRADMRRIWEEVFQHYGAVPRGMSLPS